MNNSNKKILNKYFFKQVIFFIVIILVTLSFIFFFQQEYDKKDKNIIPTNETVLTSCQTNADCLGIICPMVIGGDTPRCATETGRCYCGAGDKYLIEKKNI